MSDNSQAAKKTGIFKGVNYNFFKQKVYWMRHNAIQFSVSIVTRFRTDANAHENRCLSSNIKCIFNQSNWKRKSQHVAGFCDYFIFYVT